MHSPAWEEPWLSTGTGLDPEQYGETVDPRNPPNSVLQPEVRKATFWAYLGPLIVIFVIVGIALLYWSTRETTPGETVEPTVGTSGETTPGGGNPDPKPDSTQEEREYRGGK